MRGRQAPVGSRPTGWDGRLSQPADPVLLVQHYAPLATALRRGLEEEGIVTHLARSDAEADGRARGIRYAGAVVAWNIPGEGGAALVRAERGRA